MDGITLASLSATSRRLQTAPRKDQAESIGRGKVADYHLRGRLSEETGSDY